MKYYYRLYGVNIESKIEVPEFEVIDSNSDIDVKLSFGVVDEEIIKLITQGYRSKYEKQDMWFYIENVAIFHIYNGDTVVIEPMGDKNNKMIKLYIMGSVMGMVLLQRNMVAIHGGGIVIDGKGCIFTGRKGAGKSTITTALRKKGYKFIADDVCSVNTGEINTIHHGFGYQKLCEDAMEKLGYNLDEFEPFRGDLGVNKYIVPAFDEFTKEEVPLEAVFEISVGDVDKVEIEEILGADKMNKLIENVFRIEMLRYAGGMEPKYFKQCLDIAKSTKMYRITRPKDVFSVEDQIRLIREVLLLDEENDLDRII